MLDLARVVGVHPESHSVDLLFLSDNRRVSSVQVLSGLAGSNVGFNDLAVPDSLGYDSKQSKTRDIFAAVGFMSGHPVVVGFLFPKVSEMLFSDSERMVYRHASDVYVTVDKSGNTEIFHPSGTFLRIGSSPAHEDLTGKDFDKKWKIRRNTGAAVHVHLSVANAGSEVASLDIDPSGNIDLAHIGNLSSQTDGNLSASVGGSTDVVSGGAMTLAAPTITLKGDITLDGPVSATQGIAAASDVTAGGISGMNHTHTEQGDGAEVSPPH